ncbi:MAG: hypothetical protein QW507_02760 [Candidatus Nanoarchaeia archaeon]|nr:hypothetical protein [Candidatus Haiyanarchaeum thermophilum]MCW1303318.1 hypothetical protein [Candidatus Haiyanarchaeum thermophilum]MCW1304100.1 hypothetical protein [Candidatus Haiyanarchaeum thermophilum]MCW1306477.1 hypothetical protein [Candidatus Haiyanarchaeum thermophilum]MCW1307226.1 hypothetical protein [Candidatus Haiyanarchaeum thermophilum]
MSVEEPRKSTRVVFAGLLDLGEYYGYLHKLFEAFGYKVNEILYRQKEAMDGSKEVEVNWECVKDVDSYTRFQIMMNLFVGKWVKVEVMKDGSKVRMDKCEADAKFKTKLIRDYRNFFKSIFSPLRVMYEKSFYRGTLESWRMKLEEELDLIENEIKAFLNLKGIVLK